MNKAQLAYEKLTDMILDGSLNEKEIYSENRLAALLGMSRTPIREAVIMLESGGSVDVFRGIGIRVKSVSMQEIYEMLPIRYMLENYALQESIHNITSSEYNIMINRWKDMKSAIENAPSGRIPTEALIRLDKDTHQLFVERANNTVLQQLIDVLEKRIDRFRVASVQITADGLSTVQQHIQILDAMRTGNLKESIALMEAHMRRPWEAICQKVGFSGADLAFSNTQQDKISI